jgi:hypothetical protein
MINNGSVLQSFNNYGEYEMTYLQSQLKGLFEGNTGDADHKGRIKIKLVDNETQYISVTKDQIRAIIAVLDVTA